MTRSKRMFPLVSSLAGLAALTLSASALADSSSILLEISADGASSFVHNYGGYLRINYNDARAIDSVDYCDNIPFGGDKPSPDLTRHGDPDYACSHRTFDEIRAGAKLISFRNIDFLTLAAPTIDPNDGGDINITFVRSVGITGVKRRVMTIRATRPSAASDFSASLVTAGGAVEPMDWMTIAVSTELHLPTGVSAVTLSDHGEALPPLDLDRDLRSP